MSIAFYNLVGQLPQKSQGEPATIHTPKHDPQMKFPRDLAIPQDFDTNSHRSLDLHVIIANIGMLIH